MKIIDYSEELGDNYEIVFGGDQHAFVRGYAWETSDRIRDYIKAHPHTYWTSHGDQIDFMQPQDRRFRFSNLTDDQEEREYKSRPVFERAHDQWEAFIDYWDPVGDKCIEVGMGNHDDRIANVVNVPKLIADRFGCQWGTPMTIVRFPHFSSFLWHPFKFGMNLKAGDPQQRYANECVRIKRAMRYKPGSAQCEVSVMSHIHKKRISPPQCDKTMLLGMEDKKLNSFYPSPTKIMDDKNKTWYYHEDHRWFCSTGALFGQYISGDYTYQETRDYDPVELGWIKGVVKNGKFIGMFDMFDEVG